VRAFFEKNVEVNVRKNLPMMNFDLLDLLETIKNGKLRPFYLKGASVESNF
jgi:hypothetical protein